MPSQIQRRSWGVTPEGEPVDLFTLTSDDGLRASICTYGGIVTELMVPMRDGNRLNVVLGMADLAGYTNSTYLAENPYFGAIIGRCTNRIRNARFTLNGAGHQLSTNEPPNHLHGGFRGFDKLVWQARADESPVPCIELAHTSADGDQGYPGELHARARYSLPGSGELRIDYETRAGEVDTIANLTNHSYFNLNGAGSGDIFDHELQIFADHYLPLDAQFLPTGEIRSLEGTDLDFRHPIRIGARLPSPDPQLKLMNGYTHNYVLNGTANGPMLAARAMSPRSGITMEVSTTEPGLQIYTASFLNGALRSPEGTPYLADTALCLEAQGFPDAINQAHFPSVILGAGEVRRSTTIYRFGLMKEFR